MNSLPSGFDALEPFADEWALPDFQARFEKRFSSSMEEIRGFYEAAQPLAEDMLVHLENYSLGEYPDDAQRLYQLLMTLAHMSIPVERHRQPRPANVTYPTSVKVTQGPAPA